MGTRLIVALMVAVGGLIFGYSSASAAEPQSPETELQVLPRQIDTPWMKYRLVPAE